MKDIDEEGVVFVFTEFEVIAIAHQSRLAHSAWRNKHDVITVIDRLDYLARLFHSVTEVLTFYLACHYKWIFYSCHNLKLLDVYIVCKDIKNQPIIQIV